MLVLFETPAGYALFKVADKLTAVPTLIHWTKVTHAPQHTTHHACSPSLTPPLALCSPSPTQDGAQSRLVETELASAQNIADFLKKIPASS